MWSTEREVAAGDTVIIWLTRDNLHPLLITPGGKDLNTKFGNFRHADLVGVPYGSKIAAQNTSRKTITNGHATPDAPRGFVHILRPTPELWTLALPHRTQILYLADIAFICSKLGVRPGSRVVEAGTGSGSFSHSVARAVGSTGHLFSYEFHEARFLKAREEFARHKMDDVVTLQHRNVCKEGFTNVDEIDAVFLDLPAPWEAVEHAKKALRKDRPARICCFSPCIEQVLRTVSALNSAGFTQITMHEVLLRPLEVFQTPPLPRVGGLAQRLKQQEQRREEKRLRQVEDNRAVRARERERKRRREEGAEGEGGEGGVQGGAGEGVAEEAGHKGREGAGGNVDEGGDQEEGTSKKRAKVDAGVGGMGGDREEDEDAQFAVREEDLVAMLEGDDADAEGEMDVDEDEFAALSTFTGASTTTTATTATTTTNATTTATTATRTTAVASSSTSTSTSTRTSTKTQPHPATATAARRLMRALEGAGGEGAGGEGAGGEGAGGEGAGDEGEGGEGEGEETWGGAPTTSIRKINVSKVLPEVRGHTSYLTFACLVPRPGRVVPAASGSAAAVEASAVVVVNEGGAQEGAEITPAPAAEGEAEAEAPKAPAAA